MKQIIKNFNNLIKKTIFKVENKTNNNFNISSFNKYLISFIALLFIYLFYLLVPLLYDKTWLQTNIKNRLINEFKINLSTSKDISYRILPSPHFLIKNSKLLVDDAEKQKTIAEIEELKVFLSQANLFDKNRMNFKKIVINNANFSLLRRDLELLDVYKNIKFSNKKIKINKSNIFIKNNLGDLILIIKIDKAASFFDNKKLLNLIMLNGEVFNIPFILNVEKQINSTQDRMINISAKNLGLNIFNESVIIDQNSINGKNIISLLNSTTHTKYDIKEKLITFTSDNSRINNSDINYIGKLSINPFDLDLNIDLSNYKISKLFNYNPILSEFIKSGLLFNDNISLNTSLVANSNIKEELFQSAKINFHIINGKINFDKTRLVNNAIGSLQVSNSSLFLKNNELIFNGDISIDIKNSDPLFSLLNTSKKSRKDFRTILINLNYDFSSNQIKFNSLKIDNIDANSQLLTIIDEFNYNNSDNLIKSRRLINELLEAYEG